jgi:hypothetical protein
MPSAAEFRPSTSSRAVNGSALGKAVRLEGSSGTDRLIDLLQDSASLRIEELTS